MEVQGLQAEIQTDEYGTVINSEDTITSLTAKLFLHGKALIAWTDQAGTQLDILFTCNIPTVVGPLQRGLRGNELYISVMGHYCFGFDWGNRETSAAYIGEKLGLGGANDTTEALAYLINGIRADMAQIVKF